MSRDPCSWVYASAKVKNDCVGFGSDYEMERASNDLAIRHAAFWIDLAEHIQDGTRGLDFITIDGGEGGTGARPWCSATTFCYP